MLYWCCTGAVMALYSSCGCAVLVRIWLRADAFLVLFCCWAWTCLVLFWVGRRRCSSLASRTRWSGPRPMWRRSSGTPRTSPRAAMGLVPPITQRSVDRGGDRRSGPPASSGCLDRGGGGWPGAARSPERGRGSRAPASALTACFFSSVAELSERWPREVWLLRNKTSYPKLPNTSSPHHRRRYPRRSRRAPQPSNSVRKVAPKCSKRCLGGEIRPTSTQISFATL